MKMREWIDLWVAEGKPPKTPWAESHGISGPTFRRATRHIPPASRDIGHLPLSDASDKTQFYESDDGAVASVTGETVRCLDDLIAACKVDLNLWETVSHDVRTRQEYKRALEKDLEWDDGRLTGYSRADGTMRLVTMYTVSATFRRRAVRPFEEALDGLLERMRESAPRHKATPPRPGSHLLVPAFFDVHFGRLSMTGDYSPDQTYRELMMATDVLLERVASQAVDRILLPVGNDLLNGDNLSGTTTKGTWQEQSAGQRDAIDAVCRSYFEMIDRLAELAPVDVVMIEGNHDRYSTYWLGKTLEARFSRDERVTVDNAQTPRKYYRYGVNLIGMEHGDQVKPEQLAMLMAAEARSLWADTRYHTVLRGHFHKAQEAYIPMASVGGVNVVTFPAFCPPNQWELLLGFTGGHRAAEARLFHRDFGPAATYPIFIDELAV